MPRLAPLPVAEPPPRKKSGNEEKKRKKTEGGNEGLDKRVIAGIAAGALALRAFPGFLGYDMFFKAPSIVGTWGGSRIDHEIGKMIRYTSYQLVLDGQRRASKVLQDKPAGTGTDALEGDRLKLTFPGREDEDGEVLPGGVVEFKVTLGRATLDLYEPNGGEKLVLLVRMGRKPRGALGRSSASTGPAAAPKDLTSAGGGKAADDALVTGDFAANDDAFRLRYPTGWEFETGARPDNMYSWARFTEGSAKVQVFADVAGSLASGPDHVGNHEEGGELAPVHGAHQRSKKNASELFADYQESEPTLFKGSGMGEGRIATFTATGGGLFGGKIRGIRVTLLTSDRRISILCEAPAKEFDGDKAAFLALCRGLSG